MFDITLMLHQRTESRTQIASSRYKKKNTLLNEEYVKFTIHISIQDNTLGVIFL